MGGEEEEQEEEGGDAVEEQEGGGETEGPDAASENVGDGGKGRKAKNPPLRFQKYKEAAKKYYLHHTDNDMVGGLYYPHEAAPDTLNTQTLTQHM